MNTQSRSSVRRLAAARLISLSGGAAAFVALNFTIYERTGSAWWLTVTLLLTFGVQGILGPFAGTLGDRFDRRHVLIVSDLVSALFFGAMVFVQDPVWLVTLAFGAAAAETPFIPASAAAIPNLVDDESRLGWANGLVSVGTNGGIMLGPLLGGVLLDRVGASGVFGANAVSFVLSAVLVWSVRGRFAAPAGREEAHGSSGALLEGVRFLFREPILRRITIAITAMVLGLGAALVADAPLSDSFDQGARGYGFIVAAWGAGSVMGAFAGRWIGERAEPTALVLGILGIGLTAIGMAASPVFWPILVFVLLNGVADGVSLVAEQSMMQRRTPDALRSRVMAAAQALPTLAMAAGFVAAGALLTVVGPQGLYAVAGVGGVIAGLWLVPIIRRVRRAQPPEAAPAESPVRDAPSPEQGVS